MKVPSPQERPDYKYWTTPKDKRSSLTEDELAAMTVEMAHYSNRRFVLGRRFRLVKDYYGIPKGTGCTVVSTWPNTEIRWDKWARSGYGANRRVACVSFDIDMHLEVIDNA